MIRVVCTLLVITAAAAFVSDESVKNDLLITLERTQCYGSCPVYKLTIRGDGSVMYEGRLFVRVSGKRTTRIDPRALDDLIQAFSTAKYWGLRDSYTSIHNRDGTEVSVTDLPTTKISFRLNGQSKSVTDYMGAPKELQNLEQKIDEIAGSKRWVAIDALTVHEEARHGWDIKSLEALRLFADAAASGDTDVVKAFIEEGADVNAQVWKETPLQRARGVEIVKLLIAAGADVNATSKEYYGTPPIAYAARFGDADSIKALIEAGASVNGSGPTGETALMNAARAGNPAIVKLLLQAGADVKSRTTSGEDALMYALRGLARQRRLPKYPYPFDEPIAGYEQKYREIQDMLLAAGAEPLD